MKTPQSAIMFAKVDEWKNSGQTLREFAASIGLSKSAFEYWVSQRRKSLSNPPFFIKLSPRVNPMVIIEATPKHRVPDTPTQIVFNFSSGMCIKVYDRCLGKAPICAIFCLLYAIEALAREAIMTNEQRL
ncbi:MAG: hypothetical protein WCP32_18590 [Bacteroidota bacterium]